MTKVYELPNDHRMIADIDETTRTCTITETLLDSLISKLNYYAEGQDEVLDKIRAEIEPKCDRINSLASVLPYTAHREIQELLCEIMDLCKAESEDKG